MKFLIAARPFNHQSFGVVCLHRLRDQLIALNYHAEIIFFTGDGKNCQWGFSDDPKNYSPGATLIQNKDVKKYLEEVKKNGFIIYPEIIFGNPIGGNNIIRYLLNSEGALKPWGMDASPYDFILVHSKIYREKFDYSLPNLPSINWLKNLTIVDFEKRNIDVTYIGKGQKYGFSKIIKNTFEVTRQWPNSQEQLRYLLSKTRFFFTFDYLSATSHDAILCGAMPCIFYPSNFDAEVINQFELPTYSASVKISNDFSIEELKYDKVKFLDIREKTIEMTKKIEESYPDRVASLANAILNHFI
jgi:hypothetical protein